MVRYSYSRAERKSWKNGFFAGLHAKKRKKNSRSLLKSKKRVKKAKDPGAWKRPKNSRLSPAPKREEKIIDWGDAWEAAEDMRSERAAIERINHLW